MCGEARSSQIQIQSGIWTWYGADRLMKAGEDLTVRVRVSMDILILNRRGAHALVVVRLLKLFKLAPMASQSLPSAMNDISSAGNSFSCCVLLGDCYNLLMPIGCRCADW